MMRFLSLATLAALSTATFADRCFARDYRVTVAAGEQARAGQQITIKLPADAPAAARLIGSGGESLPLQRLPDGTAQFFVPYQAAGASLAFRLTAAAEGASAEVRTVRQGPRLDLVAGDASLLSYWVGERPRPDPSIDPVFLRSGFIHPVRSPAGVEVTDSYAANHLHHHGIWSPWTKVVFQGRETDFWNMGQKRGKVEAAALTREWAGPVHGGFAAQHRFLDFTSGSPVVALHETWEVTVYQPVDSGRPARVFDLVITQTCATDDPLVLPEYHYGGLGFRGHAQWNGATQARFLTSEGLTDRVQAHATRSRWCHVGGEVDGRLAGTAILGHPGNFRAPQPMRIHPTEPFFCYAPSQLGQWQITPGEPYVARYRFVVMDGEPDRALLDAYWAGYATPATATVDPW
jgi:hypothetical protein